MIQAIVVICAYLVGSFPTGVVLAKWYARVDVRDYGSRNIGATNVARVVGKKAGVLTLALDIVKGALPVGVTLLVAGTGNAALWWAAAAGLAAFLGHLFPLYLGFRGGKGVATALGVFLPLIPKALPGAMVFFLAGFLVTRRVSVGSLAGCLAVAPCTYWIYGAGPLFWLSLCVASLIVVKHHTNIRRLVRGEEPKFSLSAKDA